MSASAIHDELRVLVIDDSPYLRQTVAELLEAEPGVRVVGRAGDGQEGLCEAHRLQPDLITLDLEMPGMDGYAFLRLLMKQRPTPVLVVTSRSGRADVWRALELGALDLVVKPSPRATPDVREMGVDLLAKIRQIRELRRDASWRARAAVVAPPMKRRPIAVTPQGAARLGPAPSRLVVIGASAGGPPALQRLLLEFAPTEAVAVVIAQHMPPAFTRPFAERLARTTGWPAREAEAGDDVVGGAVLVAPGVGSLSLEREGGALRVAIGAVAGAPFTPSVNRLFESAAAAMGADVLALVLTGMRGDGAAGVRAVRAGGGRVIAESRETAVVFGMPEQAIETGAVHEVLPLGSIADAVARFSRRG